MAAGAITAPQLTAQPYMQPRYLFLIIITVMVVLTFPVLFTADAVMAAVAASPDVVTAEDTEAGDDAQQMRTQARRPESQLFVQTP